MMPHTFMKAYVTALRQESPRVVEATIDHFYPTHCHL
jgi:hypothetical protein